MRHISIEDFSVELRTSAKLLAEFITTRARISPNLPYHNYHRGFCIARDSHLEGICTEYWHKECNPSRENTRLHLTYKISQRAIVELTDLDRDCDNERLCLKIKEVGSEWRLNDNQPLLKHVIEFVVVRLNETERLKHPSHTEEVKSWCDCCSAAP